MSLLERATDKAVGLQSQSIHEEAAKAGWQFVGGEVFVQGASGLAALWRAFTQDDISPTLIQVFRFALGGQPVLLYVQPYAGALVLPGEHHVHLGGAPAAALALTDEAIFGGPKWKAATPELEPRFIRWLNQDCESAKRLRKQTQFVWPLPGRKLELEWALQLFSIGGGGSTLVMKTGRYGGLMSYQVGFSHLRAWCSIMSGALSPEPRPAEEPLYPTAFAPLFRHYVLDDPLALDSDLSVGNVGDLEQTILQVARRYAGEGVYIDDIPADIDDRVRDELLEQASAEDVLAVFDLGGHLPGSEAVVFTPSYCVIGSEDELVEVDLFEIAAVVGTKGLLGDTLVVRMKDDTECSLSCGVHVEAVRDILSRIPQGA